MSLERILARNAAEKAAGVKRVYNHGPNAARTAAPTVSLPALPCALKGDPLTGYERATAGKSHGPDWRHCLHAEKPLGEAVCPCMGCGPGCTGYQAEADDGPSWSHGILTYDHRTLYPGLPGKRLNAGLMVHEGGYLFCWRDGWAGSNLWLCRLDAAFRPVGPATKLELHHPDAAYGREDPQLFIHAGAVHVAFVGVVRTPAGLRISVLYARLNPDLTVAAVYSPKSPGVDPARWEKNWQWFERDGQLYAVYSIDPHRVLRIDGDRAEWAYETVAPLRWKGGELRGGATPVLVGDEYWCFFHDKTPGRTGRDLYRVGLYTFDAKPPFAIRRYTPRPVLTADPITQPKIEPNYCEVIFPRGAVRVGADWVLSCGAHDRFVELHRLAHADLEEQLVRAE